MASANTPLTMINAPEGLYRMHVHARLDDSLAEKDVPLRVSLLEIRSPATAIQTNNVSCSSIPAVIAGSTLEQTSFMSGDDQSYPSSTTPTSNSLLTLFTSATRKSKAKSIVAKSNSSFVAKLVTLENLQEAIRSGRAGYGGGKEVVHIVGSEYSTTVMHTSTSSLLSSSLNNSSGHNINGLASTTTSLRNTSAINAASMGSGSIGGNNSITTATATSVNVGAGSSTPLDTSAQSFPSTRKSSISALLSRQRKSTHSREIVKPITTVSPPPSSYHWLFFNLNRSFVWLDQHATVDGRPAPLSRIYFIKALPTCHAVNQLTRSVEHVDICIGFSTGDIMWYEPVHHRYHRVNKQGVINLHAVTALCWLPGSESLFLASFADGTVLLLDKDREDHECDSALSDNATTTVFNDVVEGFRVRSPPKSHKYNPLSMWLVGSGKPVMAFAFSPDLVHVALVSSDGFLRIVDFNEERCSAVDTFKSYFGGLTCVCWSPDGKYILTGGQDDLVTIWSFRERRIIARCRGHSSWVSDVAFDKFRCDDRNYRFGSVGQDGKLIFWDMNVKGVYRARTSTVLRRSSVLSSYSAYFGNPNSHAPPVKERQRHIFHPVLGANEAPILEPIMAEVVSTFPLWSLVFSSDSVVITCSSGCVLMWDRPSEAIPGTASSSSSSFSEADLAAISNPLSASLISHQQRETAISSPV